jgi:hypothetical protein
VVDGYVYHRKGRNGENKRKPKMVDKGGGVEVVLRFKRGPQGGGGGFQRTWRSGLSGNLTERKLMAV